jgi:two-component system LytT family sensor kinase
MKRFKLPFPYYYAILGGVLFVIIATVRSYFTLIYWNEYDLERLKQHFIVHCLNYILWGILAGVVYYLVKKYRIYNPAPLSERLKALVVSFLMASLHEFLSNVVYLVPGHYFGFEPFTDETCKYIVRAMPAALVSRFIEYWIIYAFFTAIDFQKQFRDKQRELVDMEKQLSQAEMKALKSQLQPHFLFNTLNTISALMEFNIKGAQKIVSNLGGLLRKVLDSNKQNFTPLSEEIDFIKNYLSIEQVRFSDRLQVKYDIEEEVLNTPVPNLLLQPLVENAIKHGFASQTGKGIIEVIAERVDEQHIRLIVRDDGLGTQKPEDELINSGIGLKNVKDRLELIYKSACKFEINTGKQKGFEVIITLPSGRRAKQ